MSFPYKAKDRYYSVKNGPEVEVRDGSDPIANHLCRRVQDLLYALID